MSIEEGDGITLHKINKCDDIKRKKTVSWIQIFLKYWIRIQYPDPDSMNPDPQHFWAAEYCSYTLYGRH